MKTESNRTSARNAAGTTNCTRSSKSSRASGAGGQEDYDIQSVCAASKVKTATKESARSKSPASQPCPSAAPKSSRASTKSGKISPRAIQEATPTQVSSAATNSDGHTKPDTHHARAVAPHSALHYGYGTQHIIERASSTPDDVAISSTQPMAYTPRHQETIADINANWRFRQGLVKAMTKLSLQAQASLRCGGSKEDAAKHYAIVSKDQSHHDYLKIMPYLEAQEPLAKHRATYEKMLVKQVKTLPIYQWAKSVSGLGEVSLAGIIGECSGFNVETNEWWSIGQMKSVSAVWKRMGLAVINGGRQRKVAGEEALQHGYVPTRRSVMWNVGECVVKAQWRKEATVHAYGKYYGERKAAMQERNEAGEYADTAADIVARMKKAGSKPLAENLAGRLTASHINNRAKRHMTKRLLRDLYVEWNRLEREAAGYAPLAEAA